MAYTPINWATGDTITADKLNKMDNGWGVESTQLFSETVTTVDSGHGASDAQLDYSVIIDAASITVNFDGTEYECPRIDGGGGSYFYGGFNNGPDFTTYPFFIMFDISMNMLVTETAGEYTVAASIASIGTSSSFDSAVVLAGVFEVVSGTTTFQEACAAFKSGKRVYVVDNSISGKTYHQPVILVNENAFEIKFITTLASDTSLGLSRLSASSADGALE